MAAIVNYATLVSELIIDFERTGDTEFAARFDTWIPQAEAGFNRSILSRQQEVTTTLTTIAAGTVALPADFLEARFLYTVNGGLTSPLASFAWDSYAQSFPVSTGGDPYAAFISGSTLTIAPAAIRTVTLDYYAKFVGLSGSNATNWIILQHPDLYVNAVRAEACAFLRDFDGAMAFRAAAVAIAEIITGRFGFEQYFNSEMVLPGVVP